MSLLLSKRILVACLMLSFSSSFAQKKIAVRYYQNNTKSSIENVRFFLVTKTDTITPKIEDEKMQISRDMEENFSLFAQFDGKTIKIGSYRPAMFNSLDAIVVGRITDFSTMKRYWEAKDGFILDNEYVIIIPNPENVLDVIYSSVKKDVNVSLHSNFKTYRPSFAFVHEVIKAKN